MASLTALILKWDHSFKVPKYLMKLNGVMTFVALFTIVNEYEQIRFQAFVPTKSLSHIHAALEGIVKSLSAYGLPQPILGFTDNVASDAATFMQYMPSLAEGVSPVETSEYPDLPQLVVPDDVQWHLCLEGNKIEVACSGILTLIKEEDSDDVSIDIGFDMEWEFTTGMGASGPQKTALVQIAVDKVVYLFYVYTLKKFPKSLGELLRHKQFLKVGRNITADLKKLARDFPDFVLPLPKKKNFVGTLDIGQLAARKKIVPKASASLASIVAATLGASLSKNFQISSWSTPEYSDAQLSYAVLDAHVLLLLLAKIRASTSDSQSLTSLTPVGQPISLYVRNHEIARGIIIEQPPYFEADGAKINVSTTKTRALIRVEEVLAPSCIVPHHKKPISELQHDQESFNMSLLVPWLRWN
ncbi:ribonuclease H-like domain-containing protein [Mycena olivaceomarginata]|nr:ribonuclease H-like domain-containing protein [Mycena olivaceomarginata]